MQVVDLFGGQGNRHAKLFGNRIHLCIVLERMSGGEGQCQVHSHHHSSVISPDDRHTLSKCVCNQFCKLLCSRRLVRSDWYFTTQVEGCVSQDDGNRLVNDPKCRSVRRMGMHHTMNVATLPQDERV